jgi:hypothetical protein
LILPVAIRLYSVPSGLIEPIGNQPMINGEDPRNLVRFEGFSFSPGTASVFTAGLFQVVGRAAKLAPPIGGPFFH